MYLIKEDRNPFGEDDMRGRIGYLIMWLMGAPIGLLLLLWVILGDNIFSRG